MGETRNRRRKTEKSKTLPSSPTHSSTSSSDFEFTISLSPRTKSNCPADELFYKGKLLPLHLTPRLSMVRTLLLASSSTDSSSDTATTASRDSSGSSNDSHSSFTVTDCDSSRPSSVIEDDEFHKLKSDSQFPFSNLQYPCSGLNQQIKKSKYFSLSRFSSVFRKNNITAKEGENATNKRMNSSAIDIIRKYLNKVKPLYEKLSQKQQQKMSGISTMPSNSAVFTISSVLAAKTEIPETKQSKVKENRNDSISHSFSGNLRYPRRKSCGSSCPSSMRSSPNHSGVLSKTVVLNSSGYNSNNNNQGSSMEELQSAIQGAIAHCKSSMQIQNKKIGTRGKEIE